MHDTAPLVLLKCLAVVASLTRRALSLGDGVRTAERLNVRPSLSLVNNDSLISSGISNAICLNDYRQLDGYRSRRS